MFFALLIVFLLYNAKVSNPLCATHFTDLKLLTALYGSYFVLFVWYFCNTYLVKPESRNGIHKKLK